jgi:hypothetical protein
MQIPIIKGIYSDSNSDYRTEYPRNLTPVPKSQGVSAGYLRPAPGIVKFAETNGVDRGGINWNDECYRVSGSQLTKVLENGTVLQFGNIGSGEQVSMDYSFDRLAVVSSKKVFLFDGTTIQQIIDPDLGEIIDMVWLDGYFVGTDGEFLVVTELNDPFSVNPFKYGSSELDPDPILAVEKLRNEIVAVNRYTIEFFDNVGGGANEFPFRRIDGAQIQRGALGTHAVTIFNERLAFLGSGKQEANAVWVGGNGQTKKLSDREVDQILKEYTEEELSNVILESRAEDNHFSLFVHLPDQTLVYDESASLAMQRPVWHTLDSGRLTKSRYRAFNFVRCYNRWICGDPTSSSIGTLSESEGSHYGEKVGWSFSTEALFNNAKSFIIHAMRLTGLMGRSKFDVQPSIWLTHSDDNGVSWSQERVKLLPKRGETKKILEWRGGGIAKNTRIIKFRGDSDAQMSVSRLDVEPEPLSV